MDEPIPARRSFWARVFSGRLWSHPDFLKMWTGQSLSELGTEITRLALPTAAITLLGAGPFQIGLLAALEFLAFPVLGLFAGVWADRLRRRRIMIVCDAGRMLALGSVPAAYFAGVLTMEQLYVVALLTGVGTVFFDVSYQAYLPALVQRTDLVEGNSKLELTRSAAQVAGPAVAGALIQVIKAAPAILLDAGSYLVSVLTLIWIRHREPDPKAARVAGATFLGEMWEGVKVVFGHPVIRLICGCTATSNLGSNMQQAVLLLFAYKQLGMTPGAVGLLFAIGSLGALVAALLAAPIARRIGVGPAIALGTGVGSLAFFLLPLAAFGFSFALIAVGLFVILMGGTIYNINQVSLRQAVIPVRLQGRLNATVRTIVWGTIPLGAFVGGILGSKIGLVPTLYVGAAIAMAATLFVLGRPVISLREQPEPAD